MREEQSNRGDRVTAGVGLGATAGPPGLVTAQ
jgi:hypothetical protein